MRWTYQSIRRRFILFFFLASGLILPASFNACMPASPGGGLEEATRPSVGKGTGSNGSGSSAGGVGFGGGSGTGSSGSGSSGPGASFGDGSSGTGTGSGPGTGGGWDSGSGGTGGGSGGGGVNVYDPNDFRTGATLRIMNYNIRAIPCLNAVRYYGSDGSYSALDSVIRSLRSCALDDTQYASYYDTRLKFLGDNIKAFRGAGLEPDVLVVQEAYRGAGGVFNDGKAAGLKAALGYSYAIYGAENPLSSSDLVTQLTYLRNSRNSVKNLMDSGLVVLSKYPLTKLGEVSFNNCNGKDCAFKKGAMVVRVAHPAGAVDIVATHLQDRDTTASIDQQDSARMHQIGQLRTLIEQKATAGYVLMAGDMGFSHNSSNSSSGVFNARFSDFTHMGGSCLVEPAYCARPTTSKDSFLGGEGFTHLYWRAGVNRVAPRQYFVDQFSFYNGSGQQGLISDRDYHLVEVDLLVRK